MKKILFVCLGNICRSAIAQGILEDKAEKRGVDLIVDSAGTSSYHIGEPPDKRMQQKAMDYHIDISNQKARQFIVNDFDQFDYILAMDTTNYQDILKLSKDNNDSKKVKLFLNYSHPNKNLDVPDPYYGGEEGFEEVYQLLDAACNAFIDKLKNEK